MKRLVGSAAVLFLSLAAACASGGGGAGTQATGATPTPQDESISTAQAETAFNDAVLAAFAPDSGVTVVETRDRATLDGTIAADGLQVTFANLVLAKRPFTANGAAAVANASHAIAIAFANSTTGVLDGAGGVIRAKIPMTNSFVQATAGWAMKQAWHPGSSFAASPCNVTIADDGAGGVLIDGSCTVSNATVTFTQLDINFSTGALSITGTIDLDDGNGNTATLTFAGTTVDVVVNGQDLGTFDLSQIFGAP